MKVFIVCLRKNGSTSIIRSVAEEISDDEEWIRTLNIWFYLDKSKYPHIYRANLTKNTDTEYVLFKTEYKAYDYAERYKLLFTLRSYINSLSPEDPYCRRETLEKACAILIPYQEDG